MLANKPREKWYFKTSALVIAFLCIGPFVLPSVWLNPRFNPKTKIIISAIIIILTYCLGVLLFGSLKSITSYYQTTFQGLP